MIISKIFKNKVIKKSNNPKELENLKYQIFKLDINYKKL